METATFTEFRKHAAHYFDAVENGETICVMRHSRLVAKITPVEAEEKKITAQQYKQLKGAVFEEMAGITLCTISQPDSNRFYPKSAGISVRYARLPEGHGAIRSAIAPFADWKFLFSKAKASWNRVLPLLSLK